MKKNIFLLILLAFLSTPSIGQSLNLLEDIVPGTEDSYGFYSRLLPAHGDYVVYYTYINNVLTFHTINGDNNEVKEVLSFEFGFGSSLLWDEIVIEDKLYISLDSPEGPKLLEFHQDNASIIYERDDDFFSDLTEHNGELFFTFSPGSIAEIVNFNPTTRELDIFQEFDSPIVDMQSFNENLFIMKSISFTEKEFGYLSNSGEFTLLKNLILNGNSFNTSTDFITVDDMLYFFHQSSNDFMELYRSDGTEAGTLSIKNDFAPSSNSKYTYAYNGKLLFIARNTDGPRMFVASNDSDEVSLLDMNENLILTRARNHVEFNDELYFLGDYLNENGPGGDRLIRTQGLPGTTGIAFDIPDTGLNYRDDGYGLLKVGDELVFTATTDTHGEELWSSDGTTAGTSIIEDILPGSDHGKPDLASVINNKYIFTYDHPDYGQELWVYDQSLNDVDMDGFIAAEDCNDNDPSINPDATDIPNNGIDEDCDGMDAVSSTVDLGDTTIKVYPNPSNGFINISTSGSDQINTTLMDIHGKGLLSSKSDIMDLSNFPDGVYFLRLTNTQKQSNVVRIVVNK